MTDFESRQLSATTDKARSSWSETECKMLVGGKDEPSRLAIVRSSLCATAPSGKLCFVYCGDDKCDCTSSNMGYVEAAKARQQSESIRQMNAEMSSLIEHAKAGEFREQGQE